MVPSSKSQRGILRSQGSAPHVQAATLRAEQLSRGTEPQSGRMRSAAATTTVSRATELQGTGESNASFTGTMAGLRAELAHLRAEALGVVEARAGPAPPAYG